MFPWLLAVAFASLAGTAHADGAQYCDVDPVRDAQAEARLLSFSARIAATLSESPSPVALISRDGLDLTLIGHRYSHAGLALRDHPHGAWTVRQLYFACDEGRARLFDQGLAGFAGGTRHPDTGFLRVMLVPPAAATSLAVATQDTRRALSLLHPSYSANAHVFGLIYQNCNQWVAEMMAAAWGNVSDRTSAQAWLNEAGFEGSVVQAPARPILWLLRISPWLRFDDHPDADLAQARLRVTLPEAIERWLRARHPDAQILEFCRDGARMVTRRNGTPFGERCEASGDDMEEVLD